LCLGSAPAAAADFYSLQVSHDGDVYRVVADVHLAAPPAEVYQVLTDYEHLTRISRSVVKSTVVQRLDGGALVYTDTRICALVFCRHVRDLQRLTESSPQDISGVVVPQEGDNVKSGTAVLHVEAEADGTRMHWELSIEPNFWVPPLIGPLLLEGSLRAEGIRSADGVEKLARVRAHLPPLDGTQKDEKAKSPSAH
jgi:hypothetical protein